MNSLCITDEDYDANLIVQGGFIDNQVLFSTTGPAWKTVEIALNRAQVAQLRDHLNKLLESSIHKVK